MDQNFSADAIIAVGDVHGCAKALEYLLEVLLPLPNKVIFLGDYVDRGESSPRVIGLLILARMQRPDWVFLAGNHEFMMMSEFDEGLPSMGSNSGYDQYLAIGGIPDSHKNFVEELHPFYESNRFLFVHGGIEKAISCEPSEYPLEELTWTYKIDENWFGKTIVRGHYAVEEPEQYDNHINLDTGCVFGGKLSAGILDDSTGKLLGSFQVSIDGTLLKYGVNLVSTGLSTSDKQPSAFEVNSNF